MNFNKLILLAGMTAALGNASTTLAWWQSDLYAEGIVVGGGLRTATYSFPGSASAVRGHWCTGTNTSCGTPQAGNAGWNVMVRAACFDPYFSSGIWAYGSWGSLQSNLTCPSNFPWVGYPSVRVGGTNSSAPTYYYVGTTYSP